MWLCLFEWDIKLPCDPDSTILAVRVAFTFLWKAWKSPNLKESKFFKNKIDYLGCVVRRGKLEIMWHTKFTLKRLQPPKDITELRSILAHCSVYGIFDPNMACISSSLHQIIQIGAHKHFDKPLRESLNSLQSRGKSWYLHIPNLITKTVMLRNGYWRL